MAVNCEILESLVCSIADDRLMLGHVASEWTGLAPILEEDIAYSSMAQDLVSHALVLYQWVADRRGCTPDDLVFERPLEEWRCCDLVTVADEFDWATCILRHFLLAHLDRLRFERLSSSSEDDLAARAGRLLAEMGMHAEHLDEWIRRLGASGDGARSRLSTGLARLAGEVDMLFEAIDGEETLADDGSYPGSLEAMIEAWNAATAGPLQEAGLSIVAAVPADERRGGRRGAHGALLAAHLTEMGEARREAPGAAW